jgi:hypothetical protein
MNQLAVDADMVVDWIGFAAQFRHSLAVYPDAAFGNVLLGFSAGGEARTRKDLLEPFGRSPVLA